MFQLNHFPRPSLEPTVSGVVWGVQSQGVPIWPVCVGLSILVGAHAVLMFNGSGTSPTGAWALTSLCGAFVVISSGTLRLNAYMESVLLFLLVAAYPYAVIYRLDASHLTVFILCYAVMWRHFLLLVSADMASLIRSGLGLFFNEIVVTRLALSHPGESFYARTVGTLFCLTIVYTAFTWQQHQQRFTVHAVQQQLARERHVQDTLLSRCCDARITLDGDGDTIRASTSHFDSLVDSKAEGMQLTMFLQSKMDEARLREAIKSVAACQGNSKLVTVTLVSPDEQRDSEGFAPKVPITEDLFIVSLDFDKPDVGFFAGVWKTRMRFEAQDQIDELRSGPFDAMQPFGKEDRYRSENSPCDHELAGFFSCRDTPSHTIEKEVASTRRLDYEYFEETTQDCTVEKEGESMNIHIADDVAAATNVNLESHLYYAMPYRTLDTPTAVTAAAPTDVHDEEHFEATPCRAVETESSSKDIAASADAAAFEEKLDETAQSSTVGNEGLTVDSPSGDLDNENYEEEGLDVATPLVRVRKDMKAEIRDGEILIAFDPLNDGMRIMKLEVRHIFQKGLLPERESLFRWFHNGDAFSKWVQAHTNAYIYNTPADAMCNFQAELGTTLLDALDNKYIALCSLHFISDEHQFQSLDASIIAVLKLWHFRKVKKQPRNERRGHNIASM